jgi:hypothetical protein
MYWSDSRVICCSISASEKSTGMAIWRLMICDPETARATRRRLLPARVNASPTARATASASATDPSATAPCGNRTCAQDSTWNPLEVVSKARSRTADVLISSPNNGGIFCLKIF